MSLFKLACWEQGSHLVSGKQEKWTPSKKWARKHENENSRTSWVQGHFVNLIMIIVKGLFLSQLINYLNTEDTSASCKKKLKSLA